MNSDFRQRVFLPIVMPLGVAIAFLVFAFALSRVLLAVPEFASTGIALGVAAYILLVASLVSARERITSRALAVGVTLGIVALLAAGVVAGMAGIRPLEHEETAAAEGGEGAEGEAATEGGEGAPGEFVAVDIAWEAAPATLPAGSSEITLVNEGAAPHNVTIEGVNGDEPIVTANGGETQTGTVELEAGEYVYYCSVPGHRANREGQITVQ